MVPRRQPASNWPPTPAPAPRCELCGRQTVLTAHHLIPKAQGRRRGESISQLPTAQLCTACHKFLHKTFSNAELASDLNTLGALSARPEVRAFVAWVQKQPSSRQVRVR